MPTAPNLALRVLLPFAAGYFLSYLYRSVNAVLGPEITRAIPLDADGLGLMTGAYFLAFAAAQLPLGILLDRFGPRRVEAALLLAAATGALVVARAEGAAALIAGRALVGFGVAACLMAALKANVQWYPRHRLALVNGIVLSAGGLGAVAAAAPIQAALAVTDWRGVHALLSGLTIATAAWLALAVPDRHDLPRAAGGTRLADQMREIGAIIASPLFRRVAPATTVAMGGFMAVQGLWAGPWLRDVAGLGADRAATALTAMAAAMAAGFLLTGTIAERLGRRGVPPIRVAAAGMAAFCLAGLAMALGVVAAPVALCAVYGFTGTAASLNYAVLTHGFPASMAGRVNTSLNLAIFVAAFALQWGMGVVIGLWPATGGGWPPVAYGAALAIPAGLGAATLPWLMAEARKAPAG